MVDLLTNVGEEWLVENNIDGVTVTVGLYNDSTDALGESATLSDITTEPTGAAYSRQSDTIGTTQIGSNYGADNDSTITFDTSDSSQTVDAAFIIVNFQSDTVAGDGSATNNLVAAGDLTQSRDLSQVSSVEIAAGDLEITLD